MALNTSITAADTAGRVVAKANLNLGSVTGNHARSDMSDPGAAKFGSSTTTKENGTNVSAGTAAGQYNSQTFWTGLDYTSANGWSMITGVGNLPTLNGVGGQ